MNGLEAHGLSADLDEEPFLHAIDLRIPPGEIHVLLGPSGCGKTTLLRTLAGLHPATGGRVLLDDQDLTATRADRRGLVLIHQDDTLFPHRTVGGNVAFPFEVRGRPRRDIQPGVEGLLRLVGLPGFADRRVHELSGGERQRAALARALAAEPRALLLDEPFSALDRPLRQSLRDDLVRLVRDRRIPALFVTHDREEAIALADRLLVMDDGRLLDAGLPARVLSRPASAGAARVLGRRNLLPYTHVRDGEALTAVGPVPLPSGAPSQGLLLVNEDTITLLDPANAPQIEDAVVEGHEWLGSHTVYRLRRGDASLQVEAPGAPTFRPGQRVRLAWRPETHVVFGPEAGPPQS